MKVWCDSIKAAGKGATAGTYDSLGTVTVKQGATETLGVIALVTNTTQTDGENGNPILRLNSKDLGISQEDFVLAHALTDGIATNAKEAPFIAEFIPYKVEKKKLDNAQLDFELTTNVTKTDGYDAAVGLVFADGQPSKQYEQELMTGICSRAIGGAQDQSDGGISATSLTSFSSGISISNAATELIGLLGHVNPNAPTAGENVVGYTKFQASQISDFSPQLWPFMIGYTPSLGTPIGTPVPAFRRNGFYWPVRFPLPGLNFTMSISQALAVGLSNAGDGIAAAKWR